jgi:gluconate:H+ symporter, GntP family
MNFYFNATFVIISILLIIILTSRFKLNAFISLFIVSLFLALTVLPQNEIMKVIRDGFGSTMASIGLLIIFGTIIGIILDKTGGTISIANYILLKTGKNKLVAALGIAGFITGLPIFCNSGYIILSGLAKSFSQKSGISMALIASVLACSLYSVHCIIPTHPGVLAASGIIQVNIGNLILIGIVFAIPGALAAYFWSRFMTKGKDYPPAIQDQDIQRITEENLPSPLPSFLPIVMPLLLITINSFIGILELDSKNLLCRIFLIIGDPVPALAIGVLFALLLIKKINLSVLNSFFEEAIVKAGPILIITAAGGMFGMIIKATGVGEETGRLLSTTGLGLWVPFLIAAIMKTAQGSSTVAIITAASFVGPMLPMLGLQGEMGKLLTMLAMGAGSMVVSHANDSYFWVVVNFSGINTNTALKVYSSATLIMGIVVFACVWLSSFFLL